MQIIRFGGPEVLDVVDIPEPEAGPGQKLYDVSAAGVSYADTHHRGERQVAHGGASTVDCPRNEKRNG